MRKNNVIQSYIGATFISIFMGMGVAILSQDSIKIKTASTSNLSLQSKSIEVDKPLHVGSVIPYQKMETDELKNFTGKEKAADYLNKLGIVKGNSFSNLRVSSGTDALIVGTVDRSSILYIMEAAFDKQQHLWLRVNVQNERREGWIAASLIDISDNAQYEIRLRKERAFWKDFKLELNPQELQYINSYNDVLLKNGADYCKDRKVNKKWAAFFDQEEYVEIIPSQKTLKEKEFKKRLLNQFLKSVEKNLC